MQPKILIAILISGVILIASCGSGANENEGERTDNDSATQAKQKKEQQYLDSVADAEKKTPAITTDTGPPPVDSASIMSTMKVLDSIAALKKK